MSREIKFRVWSEDERRFLEPIDCTQLVIRPLSGNVTDGATTPNVSLLQYTGLKDKNGVEIYEGDVLEFSDYSNGLYLFREQPTTRETIKWNKHKTGYFLRGMAFIEDVGKKAIIIGNIHENPELLEDDGE